MKIFNDLKFFGLYPMATWYIPIHCDNCHYEGKCGVDKYNYTFFILATLFVLGTILTIYYLPDMRSRYANGLITGGIVVLGAYLSYFFRAQKYPCPQCYGCYGTPLKFHHYLKNQK